jgi:hypothetical protein
MTGISESARTWEIERGTSLRRSTQGEVISESPVHMGTMRSDSLRELASHGLGGSESIDSVAEGGFDWLGSASPGIGAVYA